MKVSEQIAGLEKQKNDALAQMTELNTKAADAGRTFDETEQTEFRDRAEKVKAIEAQIECARMLEKSLGSTAQPVQATSTMEKTYPTIGRVVSNVEKGTGFIRYVKALAAANGNPMLAAEYAKQFNSSTPEVYECLKAASLPGTTTGTTWAAPLAGYTDMSSEFIETLRPLTIFGQMNGMRRVPFNIRMPRQTGSSTANWVGEAAPKPVGQMAFDDVTLGMYKLAGIIVITDELARNSTPSAEAIVRTDLTETIAATMDASLIDPTFAGVAGVSPPSITYGAPTMVSSGATVAAITADLTRAMANFANANIPARSRTWIMNPRTFMYLATLRTSQDVFAFPSLDQNRLFGIPVIQSTNMPLYDADGAGTGTAFNTTIVLVEASEIFLADDGQVSIDVSREASLQMNTTPSAGAQSLVSMFQNNMIAIRAERYINWQPRRAAAVFTITGVTY